MMRTSPGIRRTGVPCGTKWSKDVFVTWGKRGITIPAHGGIARPECVESCAVGISEGGRCPSKLVDPNK